MATGINAGGTWNTTAGNKTVVATPAVGDLIVVVHGMSDWASNDNSVITDNNSDGLGTYTRIGTATAPLSNGGGTACALWVSVRNSLVGSASSTTFTVTNTGDTGGGLTVLQFSGMTRVGGAAIRQYRGESNATENPPTLTFGATTLTGNPVILAVMGEDNPPALTSPTGFTEAADTGWATPTTGIQVCWDDAGNTATLFSWSAGALTDHNEIGVELDTTAAPPMSMKQPVEVANPARRKSSGFFNVASSLLLTTLAAVSLPFVQYDWPNPTFNERAQQPVFSRNIEPAAATAIFRVPLYTPRAVVQQPRHGQVPNLLVTTLAPAVGAPFRPYNFELPRGSKAIQHAPAPNLLGTTLAAPVAQVPFFQNEWANPKTRLPAQQISFSRTFTFATEIAAFRGPLYTPRAVVQQPRHDQVSNLLVTTLAPAQQAPFAPFEFQQPRAVTRAQPTDYRNAALYLPVAAAGTPFTPVDWPLPRYARAVQAEQAANLLGTTLADDEVVVATHYFNPFLASVGKMMRR